MPTDKAATAPTFSYPTQDDVHLNPLPDTQPHWSKAIPGATPHLPKTEGQREYNPELPLREYDFLLRDVLGVKALEGKVSGYEDTQANFNTIKNFAPMAHAIHAVSHDGDRDPVLMRITSDEPGKRHIETFLPPSISGPDGLHKQYSEGKWTGMSGSRQYGGMGLPQAFAGAISEMTISNPGYAVLEKLSAGVAKAIDAKGSDELKDEWLPRLNSGQFSAAMVMTEARYGSSLKDMETTVQLDANGNVGKVYGYKRFISSADHDATIGKNGERQIVHMVLARTADADGNLMKDKTDRPVLTLVLVPRVLLDKDGNYVDESNHKVDKPDTNHVRITKLNDKMGLEVQSNTDVAYDGAKGFVVGNVGDGLKNMFVIMNAARLGVGLQGVGVGELARQNVERYVQERKQGPAGAIINYTDVQHKLLTMRAHVDAGRAMVAEVGMALDKVQHTDQAHMSTEERAELQKYVDVMTPMTKWGPTEKCYSALDECLQAMGGEGYMRERGIAQCLTDLRIARIYEGSNPVLALGEITVQFKNMGAFLKKVRQDMAELNKDESIADITAPVNTAIATFESAIKWLQETGLEAKKDKIAEQKFQAAASPFMELMYEVTAGVALARNAHVANEKLHGEKELSDADKKFYEAKVATARYYSNAVIAREHAMHYEKMTQNMPYLELPDLGITKDGMHPATPAQTTLIQKGGITVNQAVLPANEVLPEAKGDSRAAGDQSAGM